jgi:hypothetical protein
MVKQFGIVLPAFPTALLRDAWQGVVWVLYKVIVGREPVKRSQVDTAAYVTTIRPDISQEVDNDPISAPLPETETNPFPALSSAGKQPGNEAFHFRSIQEAQNYAETLLLDRLSDLVMTEKLDKSIAIKVGMRAPTGRAYQAAKEKLEAAILAKSFPALTASRQAKVS